MDSKLELKKLYEEITKCAVCPDIISQKVMLEVEKLNISSEVMIIAEAMAYGQVRLSGIYYFYPDGKISNTGKNLDKFLNKFGYTVYPEKKTYVYSTEIVHCCPMNSNKIRRPTNEEIKNCLNRGFLKKEIDIIKPKVIFLMGKTSYESFYLNFLNKNPRLNLTEKIKVVCDTGIFDKYGNTVVIPIQHPSGANPNFRKMLSNETLFQHITNILKKE